MTTLVRARLSTIGLFFAAGFALSMWVAHIPAVEAATGISHAALGSLLLLLGLGSVIGMQLAGLLIDKVGSKVAAVASLPLLVGGVLAPGFASDAWGVGAGLLVLGLGQGVIDVAMNDQAVIVEQRSNKPIMSSFHAFFSVGGALGAVAAALMHVAGLPLLVALIAGAACAALIALASLPGLYAREGALSAASGEGPTQQKESERGGVGRPSPSVVVTLAALAFMLMLAEGAANDWSALHAVKDLGVDESAGALAYAAFAVAMTVGRFAADWIVRITGPGRVVRIGSSIAAVGCLVVIVSPSYPMVLMGWAVFGLGLSGTVPQIFSAAGNLSGAQRGTLIARIVGAGYVGFMAGPALIGWAAEVIGLSAALFIPVGLCILALLLSFRVTSALDWRAAASETKTPS